MNDKPEISIESEAEFLAHTIALKLESEERLQGLSDTLSEHHNLEAAAIFQSLVGIMQDSIVELEVMAKGLKLPVIAPWDYQWHCSNDPAALCIDQAHYLMNSRQSLELALFNEQRSLDFFQRVYQHVDNPQVKKMAEQLIQAEHQFAANIKRNMASMEEELLAKEDFDPPNVPE
jgi:hypothetical protein